MAHPTDVIPPSVPSFRMRSVRSLAWVLAVVAAVPFFGLIDLATLVGWVNPEFEWPVPLEVSWGVLFTFTIAGSYVSIALRPYAPWPGIVQLGIAASALALSSLFGSDIRPFWVALPVAGSAVLFAVLTGPAAAAVHQPWSLRWSYGFLAVAGAAIWIPYAAYALGMSRLGVEGDITNGIEHWPVQGAAGLAVLLGVAALAVWSPGRLLLRVTVSLSATLIGAGMLAYPDRDGAMDSPLWGIVMVMWGTAVAIPHVGPAPALRMGRRRKVRAAEVLR